MICRTFAYYAKNPVSGFINAKTAALVFLSICGIIAFGIQHKHDSGYF